MRSPSKVGSIPFAAALLLFCLLLPGRAQAIGTHAGEKIENTASAEYKDESLTTYTSTSNKVTVTITEVYAAQLSCQAGQSANSSTEVIYWCKLINSSNAKDTFTLNVSATPNWPVKLYADDGAGGGTAQTGFHDPGENTVLTTPFTTPELGPDGVYWVFVSVTVPAGTANGLTSTFTLKANGSGDPSNTGTDDKEAGAVTTAKAPSLTLNKSVRNLTLGTGFLTSVNAKPGDTLEYRIEVINDGTVAAGSVMLTDTLDGYVTLVDIDGTKSAIYVGSVDTDGPSNGAPKTRAGSGDPDCGSTFACGTAQYNSGNRVLTFYLGSGATESGGGQLGTTAPNKTVYAFFRVTVN